MFCDFGHCPESQSILKFRVCGLTLCARLTFPTLVFTLTLYMPLPCICHALALTLPLPCFCTALPCPRPHAVPLLLRTGCQQLECNLNRLS